MKNKVLLISLVFILISFCFINNCFAYQLDTNKSNYKLYISDQAYEKLQTFDEYKSGEYYYFVRYWDNNTYQYFFFHASDLGDIKFVSHDRAPLISTGAISTVKQYNVSANDYSIIGEETLTNYTYSMNFYTNVDGGSNWGYISNFTIYWDEACSQVFFYQPPIVLPEPPVAEQITLAGIMKTAGEQAIQEIAMITLVVLAITAGLMVLLNGLIKAFLILKHGFRH